MVTITRRLAHHIRAVMRRAFGTRGPGPAVCFTVVADTLNVKARVADIAVEYSEPTRGSAETLWLPFQFLDDCAGQAGRAGPHRSDRQKAMHRPVARRQRAADRPLRLQTARRRRQVPPLPETFAENRPGLLEALTAAADTCDPDSMRYCPGRISSFGASKAPSSPRMGGNYWSKTDSSFLGPATFWCPAAKSSHRPNCPTTCPCRSARRRTGWPSASAAG